MALGSLCTRLAFAAALLAGVEAAPADKPRSAKPPAVALGGAAGERVRVFMAVDGGQDAAPLTGQTTVVLEPGETVRIMVWIEDTTADDTPFDGYQLVLPWSATPFIDAAGDVTYVDGLPGVTGIGDSMFLDPDRADWAFADQPVDFPVFYNETPPDTDDAGFFGLIYTPAAGLPTVLDDRGIAYLGEFDLRASANAAGQFEFTFRLTQPPLTQMFQPQGTEFVVDEYQALSIVVGAKPLDSVPPIGSIDARQPTAPDGSNPDGFDQLRLLYVTEPPLSALEDFAIEVSGGEAPALVGVFNRGNDQILQFDQPIPVGECTTIVHLPSGFRTTLGYLPGDVDGNGTTAPLDILALIDGLNGVLDPPLVDWQCDIDRSGACQPADILREIDVLDGASEFEAWNGRSLPACP